MICGNPRPTSDIIVSNSSSPGNAIQASTNLCTARSSLPPKNPEMPPIINATTTLMVVAARPTVSEIRAPKTRRLSRSRPNWSVPSRYRLEGACIRSTMFTSSCGNGASTSAKIATRINSRMTTPAVMLSGFSLTNLTKNSFIAHPGVQHSTDQVDHQIDHHHPGGENRLMPETIG